jgi:hypothetical protein
MVIGGTVGESGEEGVSTTANKDRGEGGRRLEVRRAKK